MDVARCNGACGMRLGRSVLGRGSAGEALKKNGYGIRLGQTLTAARMRDEDDEYEDGDGDPCPQCGKLYSTNEFWIACDFCDTWYCGRCAKMTEAKAEKVDNWKCPQCTGA
eukprot:352841-Chlamydomonas_euryale.AAC.1